MSRTILEKTGLIIDAYFSATKIRWILENVKDARKLADEGKLAFGTIDSWLVWNLTRGKLHVTDVSNASRTMLFNIHTLQWDEELLRIFNIPSSMLPEVRSSSEVYGNTEGLFSSSIPVAGIAGDQQAALFGQMCIEPGMVKNTYGTGCFMVMNIGNKPIESKSRLLTTVAWKIGNDTQYALEGSIFIAGAVVQWLRDSLGIIKKSGDVEKLASQVKDSDGVYFVPAFAGLGAPHWNQHARGTMFGLQEAQLQPILPVLPSTVLLIRLSKFCWPCRRIRVLISANCVLMEVQLLITSLCSSSQICCRQMLCGQK